MRFTLLSALFFSGAVLFAQNTPAYIIFSVYDGSGNSANAATGYTVTGTILTISDHNDSVKTALPLQYDNTLNAFIATPDKKYNHALISINLQNNKIDSLHMRLVFDLRTKFQTPADFVNLYINSIPMYAGKVIVDIPSQKESWGIISDIQKPVNGKQVQLKDITILQNWQGQEFK